MYTAPRLYKSGKKKYCELQEGEAGRYAVLSVTNPNYTEDSENSVAANLDTAESFVKMNYNNEITIDRTENKVQLPEKSEHVIDAIPIKSLLDNPLPQSV